MELDEIDPIQPFARALGHRTDVRRTIRVLGLIQEKGSMSIRGPVSINFPGFEGH